MDFDSVIAIAYQSAAAFYAQTRLMMGKYMEKFDADAEGGENVSEASAGWIFSRDFRRRCYNCGMKTVEEVINKGT